MSKDFEHRIEALERAVFHDSPIAPKPGTAKQHPGEWWNSKQHWMGSIVGVYRSEGGWAVQLEDHNYSLFKGPAAEDFAKEFVLMLIAFREEVKCK